ncbi:class I SAM-dependent methyltransferase [Flavonifractor plautii]|nr:class I SAM-dependent methyltransferase [Flavonifractor plautii]
MAYEFLAGCYDAFTADVHYARWADYLEKHFARSKLPIRTVLDLACGTGSLTRVLAERGYEMIGADLSQEMLAQAAEKCRGAGPIEPIFLHQAMEELDLYGTIDACVCCLDSINYVTSPKKLARAFRRVHTFLMPGGLFLFDINTPQKLRGLDGQMFLDESEDAYCVWRADWSERRASAPMEWTSSGWSPAGCGAAGRRFTRSTPTNRRSWRSCSGRPVSGRSDNTAS